MNVKRAVYGVYVIDLSTFKDNENEEVCLKVIEKCTCSVMMHVCFSVSVQVSPKLLEMFIFIHVWKLKENVLLVLLRLDILKIVFM